MKSLFPIEKEDRFYFWFSVLYNKNHKFRKTFSRTGQKCFTDFGINRYCAKMLIKHRDEIGGEMKDLILEIIV